MGSTIAKKRSADKAVRVKTETPIDTSFPTSDILHNIKPNGQESSTYAVLATGTAVKIT